MLLLYTAIGELKFKKISNGQPVPFILNNQQEYGLSEHELILWSCLAFHILTFPELQEIYSFRLKEGNCAEALPMSHYLNRLLYRGLIAKGCGMTGVDSLYDLLGKLYIIPAHDSYFIRLLSCILLLKRKKIHVKDLFKHLKKSSNTEMEKTILSLSSRISLTVAKTITSIQQNLTLSNQKDVLEQLYPLPTDTCETLENHPEIHYSSYPVLQAICNLYLNKQINFHQF